MSNRYQLVGLKDDELLVGVSRLVAQGNELTGDVLAHLVEVESRMLHAELGFPNLFSYCVESLGLSEGAAGTRCTAARVCRRFPEAFDLVARGDLHLSALCAMSLHLTPDNAAELFAACRRKPRRRVDEILAARFPKPDAKESVRRLPTRTAPRSSAVPALSKPAPAPLPTRVAAHPPAHPPARPPAHLPPSQEVQPTAADRYKVQFTADLKLRALIESACALCPGHSSQGQLAAVVAQALELLIAQQEKRRFAVGRKPRKVRPATAKPATATPATASANERMAQSTPPGGVRRRRAIKAADRRIVHEHDQGRCAWVAPDGRRCAERARLQFDYRHPWAKRGPDDAGNLRLLCPTHNRLHARHCFGELHIQAKIAARRAATQPAREPRRPP